MTSGKNKKNFQIYTPEEFIAAITQHIPGKSFQMVRYQSRSIQGLIFKKHLNFINNFTTLYKILKKQFPIVHPYQNRSGFPLSFAPAVDNNSLFQPESEEQLSLFPLLLHISLDNIQYRL